MCRCVYNIYSIYNIYTYIVYIQIQAVYTIHTHSHAYISVYNNSSDVYLDIIISVLFKRIKIITNYYFIIITLNRFKNYTDKNFSVKPR